MVIALTILGAIVALVVSVGAVIGVLTAYKNKGVMKAHSTQLEMLTKYNEGLESVVAFERSERARKEDECAAHIAELKQEIAFWRGEVIAQFMQTLTSTVDTTIRAAFAEVRAEKSTPTTTVEATGGGTTTTVTGG